MDEDTIACPWNKSVSMCVQVLEQVGVKDGGHRARLLMYRDELLQQGDSMPLTPAATVALKPSYAGAGSAAAGQVAQAGGAALEQAGPYSTMAQVTRGANLAKEQKLLVSSVRAGHGPIRNTAQAASSLLATEQQHWLGSCRRRRSIASLQPAACMRAASCTLQLALCAQT